MVLVRTVHQHRRIAHLGLTHIGGNVANRPADAPFIAALDLGFVPAVFDNIPLTALALKQGGFDWGMLAYTVGFGGSMIWFGSSAGVALSNMYPGS